MDIKCPASKTKLTYCLVSPFCWTEITMDVYFESENWPKVKRCFLQVEVIGKFKTIFFWRDICFFSLPAGHPEPRWPRSSGESLECSLPPGGKAEEVLWVFPPTGWAWLFHGGLANISALGAFWQSWQCVRVEGLLLCLMVLQVTTAWWHCSLVSYWTSSSGYSQNTVTLTNRVRPNTFPRRRSGHCIRFTEPQPRRRLNLIITSNGWKLILHRQYCFTTPLRVVIPRTHTLTPIHTDGVLLAIYAVSWHSSQPAVATETVVHGCPAQSERKRAREKYEQRNRVRLPPLLCLPIILRSHGHRVLGSP